MKVKIFLTLNLELKYDDTVVEKKQHFTESLIKCKQNICAYLSL